MIDHTHGEPVEKTESDRDTDHYEIPAHCAILASRCRWFQRALLSGMRESIDKYVFSIEKVKDIYKYNQTCLKQSV